ncbi:MAG: nucleoside deaminase [Actinomycetota bacterium]
MTDDELMGLAISEAKTAMANGDVPVGAVIVLDDEVIASRHDEREQLGDPTACAELLAISDATAKVGSRRLDGATIAVTIEPSVMCAGAILDAGVARLIFGIPDMAGGATGSLYHVGSDPRLGHEFATTHNVRADECAALLDDFRATTR